MKKIIAFAGSNSKNSINKQLATYAANLLEDVSVTVLDLNDYPLSVYGIDEEAENGIPENATNFLNEIKDSDGVVLSLAEHNGNFSVAFKNVFDWMSRIDQKLWSHKPILVMATSPGGRGGASVLSIAKAGFPHMGGNVVTDFSLPSFYDNFKDGRIVNEEQNEKLKEAVVTFQKSI
ncbi:NAD(P)H-dependent oxidoreductase [Tenacibaculum sp. S7007]|uniref:NAD(P)H-dependent oxidoreductase n=1 Tax=Tenacibaculum pelagium TaxID=2759527 RepID=A0A839ALR0_9FLAO|nr:NAD(P)H-dependent oxidoreductase [Tenacibaculum pelagium]MBA6155346.1 NAD(P)H-dependent oxidoreductase [Tenacibaculum pelagium]